MTPESAPPLLGGSPIEGAADSVAGATDRSVNRERNKRRRRNWPTPPGERQLNVATTGKDVAAEQDIKGKGKAIADYESAASPAPRSSPAPSRKAAKGFGKSPVPGNDDDIFASPEFPESVITAALAPMSNLRRSSSAPIEIFSSSGVFG